VSSYSPVGYIVTRIVATDADIGGNAQLVYSMKSAAARTDNHHHGDADAAAASQSLPFDVDSSNGAVYVTSSLRGVGGSGRSSPRRDYVLSVTVSDRGSPPLTAGAHNCRLTVKLLKIEIK